MKQKSLQALPLLRRLARWHGVATRYLDMAGRPRPASTEVLLGVLATLGVPVTRVQDVPDAWREARRQRVRRALEPVHVVWQGRRTSIPFLLPEESRGTLGADWHIEGRGTRRTEESIERLPVQRLTRVDGLGYVTRLVPVPPRMPPGYHRLDILHGRHRFKTEIFCAPEACFQGAPGRAWGLFAPLYALHSERSWGGGDLGDLHDFIAWVGEQGGRFVGTLPLLPAFLEKPCEPSPYSPVSRLFWNEFYLDLTRVPEMQTTPAARRLMQSGEFLGRLEKLRANPLVDYASQAALKRQVLEKLSRHIFRQSSDRRQALEKYLTENPRVGDYARFRAVQERRKEAWFKWPARMRQGQLRDADGSDSGRHFHLYAQWLAHEQMSELSNHAARQGVELYLDMPLGTHREGYDGWRHQGLFVWEAAAGAPPDPVFTKGQNWGFAPVHPERSREQGHAYMRAYLSHHLQHARMLRFDHVMGLHRLYWVPLGWPANRGAYVRYPAEEYYAMISIESHRHRSSIIGENLGTISGAVNRSLKRHGVRGMFVVQYEVQPPPRPALRRVPESVVASLNTHDMPPFAAFWKGLDLIARRNLGNLPRARYSEALRCRERIRRSFLRWLRSRGEIGRGRVQEAEVCRAALMHLGGSAARWVLLNVEDLWLETESQNMPGTTTECVNWRRKIRHDLRELGERREVQELLASLGERRK